MSNVLSDISEYVSDKVSFQFLNEKTYIGMDNLIPNRGGVTISEYVPFEGQFTAFRKGDVLLGNIRPYFKKIWLAEYDGGCSPDVLCIRAKDGISPLFLYAVLAQDAFFDYDVKGAKGSKMPRGDKDHIMSYPVPEIENADGVGFLVDSIYRKIQNNNAICSNLESMVKMLYDYWFVQFDFHDENGKPYKSSGGKMVWNEKLKREIPVGWEVKRLGNLINHNRGVSYTGNDMCELGTPIISLASIDRLGRYIPDSIKYYNQEYPSSKVLKPYDLVMANTDMTQERAVMGKIIFVPDIFEGDILSTHHITKITISDDLKAYLMMTTQTDWFHKYIKGFSSGTNVLGMDMVGFEDYMLLCPPQDILLKFNRIIYGIYAKIFEVYKENFELASLRDFLLPMLMNGQVKVGKVGA